MGVSYTRILLVCALVLSWILLGMNVYSTQLAPENISRGQIDVEQNQEPVEGGFLESLFVQDVDDVPSPCDRIKEEQIWVFDDKIVIDFQDAEWATFTDTNSMDPVIDVGANAIEYVPKSEDEICVGDIVSYHSKYAGGIIIHRVVETGYDSRGWYAVMKGDNVAYNDPGKVRFNQIQRVVIGIIY